MVEETRRDSIKRLGRSPTLDARRSPQRDGQVVAGVLAFDPDFGGDPPHGRMKEQPRFEDSLPHVDQMVPTPQMSQLVSQHRLDLLGRGAYARWQM